MPFMESQTRVHVLSPLKLLLTLWLCVLLCTVSVRGNYQFTVRFYEFRNPLGLQCGECENDGPPACCDDVQRNESCINEPPHTCDTRFRFMLRPFGASVKTAPNSFPHYTRSNGGNSDTFNEAAGAFLALPNPFTITNTSEWTGRTQFFIDALDNDIKTSGIDETEVIINRFPIDLVLELGAGFTERTTYTGIYNISGLGFDMSFRVQCSENYHGPNCSTHCEPMGVYTCDSEGNSICVQSDRDPATHCTTCLQGSFYDIQTDCTQCLLGRDISSNCTTCLTGYDPSTSCTECLPDVHCQSTQLIATAPVTPTPVEVAVVGGAVGGAAIFLILILVILCMIIIIITIQLRRQRQKYTVAGTVTDLNNAYLSRDSSVKETAKVGGEHDFDNPLYDESKKNGSQWQADNSAYSKLQRPPMQKSFVPPKFPYTMERSEETSYQLDVAGKGADDGINSEQPAYDIAYPPPPPPSFSETGEAYDVTHHPNHQFLGPSPAALVGGIYNLANYPEQPVYDDANLPLSESTRLPRNDYSDITDIPGSTVITSQAPAQHDYADIPDPQSTNAPHYDYADTALSMSSQPPLAANDPTMSHDYAETEDVVTRPHPSESPSNVAYANTTPGQVTPEAMDHYDFNQ